MCKLCTQYNPLVHRAMSQHIINELTRKIERMSKIQQNYRFLARRTPIQIEKDSKRGLIQIDNRQRSEKMDRYVSDLQIHLREVKRYNEMVNN